MVSAYLFPFTSMFIRRKTVLDTLVGVQLFMTFSPLLKYSLLFNKSIFIILNKTVELLNTSTLIIRYFLIYNLPGTGQVESREASKSNVANSYTG